MELKKKTIALPALRGVIGDWVYYSSLMSASQVSKWVKSAKDIREAKSLHEVLQRDLKERKKQISHYLLNTESRFFNSIIVGVYGGLPDWIEFDISKKLNELESSYDDNITDSMGLLVFHGDEEMFAIDGQHRVAGIDIAINEDSSVNKENSVLTDDTFSVIFLAHVDDKLGRKRTRKLFSDINKNAKPVATSDKIVIDEEDMAAITARRVYHGYKYFKNGTLIDISPKSNIDKDNTTHFTNLDNLYKVCKTLRPLFIKYRNTDDWDEKNINKLYGIVCNFFNVVIENLAEYHKYFIDGSIDLSTFRRNNKYLIFRPIGITLLARLYVHYKKINKLSQFKRDIKRIDLKGDSGPLNKVLWNSGKMEAKATNQNLAFNLCLYIMGELPIKREHELLEKYREITKNISSELPNKLLQRKSKT